MRHPEKVPTDFGWLSGKEAWALIQMLDHDGILVLRKLLKGRLDMAVTTLRSASSPADQAMFDRGAMDAVSSIDEILLAIRKNYDDAADKESITDGTQHDRSPSADDGPGDEPGPG
jgi:hypothetical protein